MHTIESLKARTDAYMGKCIADSKASTARFDDAREVQKTALTQFKTLMDQGAPPEVLQPMIDKLDELTAAMKAAGEESASASAALDGCVSTLDAVYAKLTKAMNECYAMARLQGEIDDANERLRELDDLQRRRAIQEGFANAGRALAPTPQPQPVHCTTQCDSAGVCHSICQ